MSFLRIRISNTAIRDIRGNITTYMSSERLNTAKKAALQAGNELLGLYTGGITKGDLKADRTLVTEADRLADRLIQSMIKEKFPRDGILSEENSTVFPETEHAWVIDPLDGTVNFSHGLLYWGVSIAHLENGVPRNGAVYFPLVNELYTASEGLGAKLNGNPLTLQVDDSDQFPVFVHCSRMHQRYQVKTHFKKRSLGAAAYHYCLVAKSSAVLAFESTPKIWDFAAGWLIVREAGGAIRALGDDQPFPAQPGLDYARRFFPVIAAGSPQILAEAVEGISPKING